MSRVGTLPLHLAMTLALQLFAAGCQQQAPTTPAQRTSPSAVEQAIDQEVADASESRSAGQTVTTQGSDPHAAVRVATSAQQAGLPEVRAELNYVGSAVCRDCHQDEHASWQKSYHRTMTQWANSQTVGGRFDGRPVEYYGWQMRPERDGDEFWLHIEGRNSGKRFDRQLVMTTGSHHMQKYWYSTGAGRELGLAPLIYLFEADRWVPEHTAFLKPPQAGLPVREGVWNRGCNQCHATGSQPRLNQPSGIDTRVAELGISCEACHGPGQTHAQQMQAAADDVASAVISDDEMVNPAKLSPQRSAQVCGQCHGAWVMKRAAGNSWSDTGHVYRPGDDLHQTRHFIRAVQDQHLVAHVQAEDSFWSDGEIRVAGREYNGLLASPCFAQAETDSRRMTCLSCHDLHASTTAPTPEWSNDQLRQDVSGNEACYQCHPGMRDNLQSHTHHAADSAGSQCYNCHMPYTSYGLLKAVRSHTISSPSVTASVNTGRPNACNQCHLDQTLDWTSQHLAQWYGQKRPLLNTEQRELAASILWTLQGDAGQRALMAWSFGWEPARQASGESWMPFYLTDLMFDSYDAVRYIAQRSMRQLPGFAELTFDHLDAARHRDAVMGQVMSTWHARWGSDPPTAARLLYDGQGGLNFARYQQLRARRDERSVTITE